jgi:alkanesulfonate monooxygenase SsuD/methylene tetrahydromethanopterin reductase-like flavin-dependent oxidoreductase (luciferase family)
VTAVGVVFRPQSPPEELRAAARAVEDAGVDELWLWEDCFSEGGLTTAAAALAWTDRLRVGVGLLPVPLRNAGLAAMELATLARTFPGRLVPALGHGVQDWMGQVGARVDSPLTLLREHTAAVRALLHGETVTVDGRYVHLDGVALDWPPASPPPLLIGAYKPRTMRLAGEVGDGAVLDVHVTPEGVAVERARLAEGRAAAGRTDPLLVVQYVTPGPDPAATVREYADAGVDTVVLVPPADAPDPRPLLDRL